MCMSYKYENQHRGLESYAPFLNFLHNHIACVLNFFQSFQANPMKLSLHNSYEEEMSITFFLWGQFQGFNQYAPFSKLLLIHLENVCVSNSFLSVQVTPMKLAALDPYEDVHTKLDKLTYSYKSKKGKEKCVLNCLFLGANGGRS